MFAAIRRALVFRDLRFRRRVACQWAHGAAIHLDRDRGFEVAPPGRFAEAAEVVQSARDLAAEFGPEENWDRAPRAVGGYSIGLLDPRELTRESAFIRFILRPDIIASAAEYLGVVPVLSSVQVWYSRFDGRGANRGRLFHLDPEDVSAMRVFVYCSDVDSTEGPLVVLPARASDAIQRALNVRCGGTFLPLSDEKIGAFIQPTDLSRVIGPAGTVVLIDTCRCYHYGSRVESAASRTFAVFTLLAPSALVLPIDYRPALPLTHLATPDSPLLERLVLGAG